MVETDKPQEDPGRRPFDSSEYLSEIVSLVRAAKDTPKYRFWTTRNLVLAALSHLNIEPAEKDVTEIISQL